MATKYYSDPAAAAYGLAKTAAVAREKRATPNFDVDQLLAYAKQLPEKFRALPVAAQTALLGAGLGSAGGLLTDFGKEKRRRAPLSSALTGGLAGGLLGLGGGLAYTKLPELLAAKSPSKAPETSADVAAQATPTAVNPFAENAALQQQVENAMRRGSPQLPEGITLAQLEQFMNSPEGWKLRASLWPEPSGTAAPETITRYRTYDPAHWTNPQEALKSIGAKIPDEIPGLEQMTPPPWLQEFAKQPENVDTVRRIMQNQYLQQLYEQYPGEKAWYSPTHNPAVQLGIPGMISATGIAQHASGARPLWPGHKQFMAGLEEAPKVLRGPENTATLEALDRLSADRRLSKQLLRSARFARPATKVPIPQSPAPASAMRPISALTPTIEAGSVRDIASRGMVKGKPNWLSLRGLKGSIPAMLASYFAPQILQAGFGEPFTPTMPATPPATPATGAGQ